MNTIDELTKAVADGQRVTWSEAKGLLDGHQQANPKADGTVLYNFDNCILSVGGTADSIPDDAVMYNPLI